MVRIPVEYQEVEYLESNGSSYINSEIIPSVSDVYTFRGEFRNIENSVLFGCRSSGTYKNSDHLYLNRNGDGGSDGTGIILLVTNTARASSRDFDKNVFFATGNNLPLEINESDVSIEGRTSSSFAPTQPIYLLGFNVLGQNSESVGGGKLSYFKINGRCEFIPCYRKSDSEPGMYDTVSGTFFINAGTGKFIVGNDVSWEAIDLLALRRMVMLSMASGAWKKITVTAPDSYTNAKQIADWLTTIKPDAKAMFVIRDAYDTPASANGTLLLGNLYDNVPYLYSRMYNGSRGQNTNWTEAFALSMDSGDKYTILYQ